MCSRAPAIPGGYLCTPAHGSIIAPLCATSPPCAASSTAGLFQLISSGILATAGVAPAPEGSRPPQRMQVSARGNVTSPQSPQAQKQHLRSLCERQWVQLGRQLQEQAK